MVTGQDGECCVTSTCANLQEDLGTGVLLGDISEDGEFLLEPLPVLEEIGLVVLVEQIPPFRGVRAEFSWTFELARLLTQINS